MFGFSKGDRSAEMGPYHIAAECELMNLEEARQGFLDLLKSDLASLENDQKFLREDAEACMTNVMQDYDDRFPEIEVAIRNRLQPYFSDAAKNGLDKNFDSYLRVRLDMLRFNLAFRAMNRQAAFAKSISCQITLSKSNAGQTEWGVSGDQGFPRVKG